MEASWELITGIAVAVMVLLIFGKLASSKRRRRYPPGPKPWPVLGNLPLLAGDQKPHILFMELSQKYGPITSLRMGAIPAVIISSPKLAELILKTHDLTFASRLNGVKLKYIQSRLMGLSPYGVDSRYLKKLYMTELLNPKRLEDFQVMRREQTASLLLDLLEGSRGGKEVAMNVKFSVFIANNLTRMMASENYFGDEADISKESFEFEETLRECFEGLGQLDMGDFIPILKPFDLFGSRKAMKVSFGKIHKFFDAILDEHRQTLDKNNLRDLVDVLLTLSTQGDESGRVLTETEMKGVLFDILLAGTDTTSATLEWAMAELLRRPDALEKAQEEIDAVVGRERLVEESDVPKLNYMRAIVREVLRLHPAAPVMVPHFSMADCEVDGYFLPAESMVFVNAYGIGRDPRVWERPNDFWPERFASSSVDVHGRDFELLPFGSGRRMCPGKNFAVLILQHTIAILLQCFDWKLPAGMSPQDVDFSERFGLVLHKEIPLEVLLTPRLPLSAFPSPPASLQRHHKA